MTRAILFAIILFFGGCATDPPTSREQADICDIFDDRKDWYRAAERSEKRWGVPIAIQMAVIKYESGFDDDARPPRGKRRFFGLVRGKRPSSAFGYAQAIDGTWEQYKRETGRGGADRDDFDDAVDFIGWYGDRASREAGVRKTDAVSFYLAYHEGWVGYSRGTWRSKQWLIDTAQRVGGTAYRYDSQLQRCRKSLSRRGLLPF